MERRTIKSIYLGGGTPSLLTADQLSLIFKKLHTHYDVSSDAEITLEANPEDVTKETLLDWHSIGINRLSAGIQSFLERDLKSMNRAHTADECLSKP